MKIKIFETSLDKRGFEMIFKTPFASKIIKKRVGNQICYVWSNMKSKSQFCLKVNENLPDKNILEILPQKIKRRQDPKILQRENAFNSNLKKNNQNLKLSKVKFPFGAGKANKNEINFFQNFDNKFNEPFNGNLNQNIVSKSKKDIFYNSKFERAFKLDPMRKNYQASDFKPLKNLHKFIFKLFMDQKFKKSDFELEPSEKIIISELLKKKRIIENQTIMFEPEFFNNLNRPTQTKKKEDCLKFIFNKAITHLKKNFRESQLFSFETNIDIDNAKFYEHYFGKIADRLNWPIECFFDYSMYNKTKNKLIAKSISKKYIQRIKLNPEFVLKMEKFLKTEFYSWFGKFNSNKIKRKVAQWENMIVDLGEEKGMKKIVSNINSRNNKLFWTLDETRFALQISLNCLSFT